MVICQEVRKLANIKSAKKRIEVAEKNNAKNRAVKSTVKTAVKKVDAAIAEGNKDAAKARLIDAEVELMKAATKGVLHKNTSSRKVSRLAKAVDQMQ